MELLKQIERWLENAKMARYEHIRAQETLQELDEYITNLQKDLQAARARIQELEKGKSADNTES